MAASGEGHVISLCLEGGSPFGLRLTGGNGKPIVVSKLHRCSKASDGGVMIGDRLLSINDFQCSDNMRLQTATDLLNVIHYTTPLRLVLFRPGSSMDGDYYSSRSTTPRNLSRPSSAYSSRQSSRSTTPTFDRSTPMRAEEPAEYHYVMAPSRPSVVYSQADDSCRYSASSSSGCSSSPYSSYTEDRTWDPVSSATPTAPVQTISKAAGLQSAIYARDEEVFEQDPNDPELRKHIITEMKREPFGDRVLTKVVREERSLFGAGGQRTRRGSLAQYELSTPGQRDVPSWYSTRRLSQGSIFQPGSRSLQRSDGRQFEIGCKNIGPKVYPFEKGNGAFSGPFSDNVIQSNAKQIQPENYPANFQGESQPGADPNCADEFEDTEQVSYLASTLRTSQRTSSKGPVEESFHGGPSDVSLEQHQIAQLNRPRAINSSFDSSSRVITSTARNCSETRPATNEPLYDTDLQRSFVNNPPPKNVDRSLILDSLPVDKHIGPGTKAVESPSITFDPRNQNEPSNEGQTSRTHTRQRPTRRQSADATMTLRPLYQSLAPPVINVTEFSGDERGNSGLDMSDGHRQSLVRNLPGTFLTANDPRMSQWSSNQQYSSDYSNSSSYSSGGGQLPPASDMARKLLSGEDVHEVVIWASKPDLDDRFNRGRRRRRFSTSQLTMTQHASKPEGGWTYEQPLDQRKHLQQSVERSHNDPSQMQTQNFAGDAHGRSIDGNQFTPGTQQTYKYNEETVRKENIAHERVPTAPSQEKPERNQKPIDIGYDLINITKDSPSGYPSSDESISTLTVKGTSSPGERPSTPTRLAIFVAKPGDEDLVLTEDNVKFETLSSDQEQPPLVPPPSYTSVMENRAKEESHQAQDFDRQRKENVTATNDYHFSQNVLDPFSSTTSKVLAETSSSKRPTYELERIQDDKIHPSDSSQQEVPQEVKDNPERKSPSQFKIPEPPPAKPVKTYDVQTIYEPPVVPVRRHSVSLTVGRLSSPQFPSNSNFGQAPQRNGISVKQQHQPNSPKAPMTPWESAQQYGDVAGAFEHLAGYQRRRFSEQMESLTAAYDRQSSRGTGTKENFGLQYKPVAPSRESFGRSEDSRNNSTEDRWRYKNTQISSSSQGPCMENITKTLHQAGSGQFANHTHPNVAPNRPYYANPPGWSSSLERDRTHKVGSRETMSNQGNQGLEESQPSFTINVSSDRTVTTEPTFNASSGYNKPRQRFSLDANISSSGRPVNGGSRGNFIRDVRKDSFEGYSLSNPTPDEEFVQGQPLESQMGKQNHEKWEPQRQQWRNYEERKQLMHERERWQYSNQPQNVFKNAKEQQGDQRRPQNVLPDQNRIGQQSGLGYQTWQPQHPINQLQQQQLYKQQGNMQQSFANQPRGNQEQQATYKQPYQKQGWQPQQRQQGYSQATYLQGQQMCQQQQQQQQRQNLPQQQLHSQQRWQPQQQQRQYPLQVRTTQHDRSKWTPLQVEHVNTNAPILSGQPGVYNVEMGNAGFPFSADQLGVNKTGMSNTGNGWNTFSNPRDRPASAMMVSSPPDESSHGRIGYRPEGQLGGNGSECGARPGIFQRRDQVHGRSSAVDWLRPRYDSSGGH